MCTFILCKESNSNHVHIYVEVKARGIRSRNLASWAFGSCSWACWTPQRNLIHLWADSLFMNTACGFSLCLATPNVASVFCHVRSPFGFIKQNVRSHPWIPALSTFKKNSIRLKGKQQTIPTGKKKHDEKVSESAGPTGRDIKEVSIQLWRQTDKEK